MKIMRHLCFGSLLLPRLLAAAEFEMEWSSLAGAGVSAGDLFELSATAGQSAGVALGGEFALREGYWSITSTIEIPAAPTLQVRLEGAELILTWPQQGDVLFQLEMCETSPASPGADWKQIGAPTWNGSEATVRLPLAAGHRFYRLHHP